jgi:hypothetical protein
MFKSPNLRVLFCFVYLRLSAWIVSTEDWMNVSSFLIHQVPYTVSDYNFELIGSLPLLSDVDTPSRALLTTFHPSTRLLCSPLLLLLLHRPKLHLI